MFQALIGPVTGLLDKVIPDADLKENLAHEIATMAERSAHESAMAQMEISKAEANHKSLFVAGWRPACGWVTVIALAYHFIVAPLILFGVAVAGVEIPELPTFDMDSLMTILLGMLGLGGLRTVEKTRGLTK